MEAEIIVDNIKIDKIDNSYSNPKTIEIIEEKEIFGEKLKINDQNIRTKKGKKKKGKQPKKSEKKEIKVKKLQNNKLSKNKPIIPEIHHMHEENIPILEEIDQIIINKQIKDNSKILEGPKLMENLTNLPHNHTNTIMQNDDLTQLSKKKISEFNLYDDPSTYFRRNLRDRKKITLKDPEDEFILY